MTARFARALAMTITLAACPGPSERAQPRPAQSDETLAFEIVDGDIRNYFFRRGSIAAHVLASSGVEPRLIVAFPAGNTGVGVWFEKTQTAVRFEVNGGLAGVELKENMRGVGGLLAADTARLEVRGAVLGSIRTIRDYVYLKKAPPETAHDTRPGPPLVMHRVTADGKHHVELVLEPRDGTTIAVENGKTVLVAGSSGAIRVHFTALADDPPLTPIPTTALVTEAAAKSDRDLRALAFLAYHEKLLAGSWRFLTYFGRDTLLSVRLMLPVLRPEVVEAALGSVLERLAPDGDVAHEEDIGDFATLRHLAETPRAADVTAPIYDYKMVDDDFLLAPVMVAYLLDGAGAGAARAKAFLQRKTSSGATFADALRRNLELVIKRATPFADRPSPTTLVAIKEGIPVGDWRDSEEGLGRGRYAFNINGALVPAALAAAARLYDSPHLNNPDAATNARRLAKAWQAAAAMFRVEVPADVAAARVRDHAALHGLHAGEAAAALPPGPVVFHALSLDAAGKPVAVMHTDDGFVLLFTDPAPDYLEQVAGRLMKPFPVGLRTPVGMVVANAAFSTDAKVRELFTPGHYHGAVVWSWQQAMLAAGLARQLARSDLPAATRATLEQAEATLWDVIDAMAEQRTGELWTWKVNDRRTVLVPFGQSGGHADESNAVQLWSTVYLGVQRPSRLAGGKR